MAQLLTKKETAAKARSMSPEVAKALARLSSGLYVVTAGTESAAKGAMVASWVAQASFEPLGLSIAVAKDRAIESLMQARSLLLFPLAYIHQYRKGSASCYVIIGA